MQLSKINAPDGPQTEGAYSQAIEARAVERVLHISGQIPVDKNGRTPDLFRDQCRLVWKNVAAQLRAADMTFENLVKVTTFLGDRENARENSEIRREFLGPLNPALTVIITGIYDKAWLLEIEAVAVA